MIYPLPRLIPLTAVLLWFTLPAFARTALNRLDPPRKHDRGQPIAVADYLNGLKTQRFRAVDSAGGLDAYAGSVSFDQHHTLKGFTYEQSVLRRLRSAGGPNRYELAPVNDPVADLIETAPDGSRRRVQLYAGGNARTAFEKLLGSDRDADALWVPRDTADRMRTPIRQAQAVWRAHLDGRMKAEMAIRQVERRLHGTGLKFDPVTTELYYSALDGRAALGRLSDGSALAGLDAKLFADGGKTSGQIADEQLMAMYRVVRPDGWESLRALREERSEIYRKEGRLPYVADRKATHFVRTTYRDSQLKRMNNLVAGASLNGVSEKNIQAAFARTAVDADRPSDRLVAFERELNRAAARPHQTACRRARDRLGGLIGRHRS